MTSAAPAVSERRDPARADRTVLRFLAAPDVADVGGATVSAGHVLEWIDRAGYACAARWSGRYCVTAYVGNVHFARPIAIGELVEVTARIIATGTTSMQVLVAVSAADPRQGVYSPATHCLLVFVAVDDDRRPQPVRPWSPSTIAELDLADRAERRLAVRARIREAMQTQEFSDGGTTPRLVLRFLASPRDVNWGGSVHGGTVMRWIDETAEACATGWTGRPTVAVYAGGIHFRRPIAIGELVEVDARVIHTTDRSLHVSVRVRAAPATGGTPRTTTECMTVAIVRGADGRAARVEPIVLRSAEDRRLDAHARELVALRAELDAIGADDLDTDSSGG
jgi:acyl-CoA hydrolase